MAFRLEEELQNSLKLEGERQQTHQLKKLKAIICRFESMSQHVSQEAFHSSDNTGLLHGLPLSLYSSVHFQIMNVKSSLGVLNNQLTCAIGEQAHY